MEPLNETSLARAMEFCRDNERVKAGVVFRDKKRYGLFCEAMEQQVVDLAIPGVASASFHEYLSRIAFRNGSELEIFILRPAQRGMRVSYLLVDEKPESAEEIAILNCIVSAKKNWERELKDIFDAVLTAYRAEELASEESEELDAFLQSLLRKEAPPEP